MFSKKSGELPSSPQASNTGRERMASKSNSTFSVLGSDLTITGDIEASADLHIDGSVEGDIACSSLVQGEESRVKGAIKAETARLAGTVDGSITARELVILKTARITGDVFYDALTIEQGAQVEGRFAHRDAKAKAPGLTQPATKPELAVAG
jgi:cytoskeletal protein CcmA (bactofilin family)